MRTTDEFLTEVKRRNDVAQSKRRVRNRRVFGALSGVVCVGVIVALSVCFSFIRPEDPELTVAQLGTASVLTESAAGGYVLMGVICFALGVVVTLVCVKWARKNDKE